MRLSPTDRRDARCSGARTVPMVCDAAHTREKIFTRRVAELPISRGRKPLRPAPAGASAPLRAGRAASSLRMSRRENGQ
jgi:hypothetical protein